MELFATIYLGISIVFLMLGISRFIYLIVAFRNDYYPKPILDCTDYKNEYELWLIIIAFHPFVYIHYLFNIYFIEKSKKYFDKIKQQKQIDEDLQNKYNELKDKDV